MYDIIRRTKKCEYIMYDIIRRTKKCEYIMYNIFYLLNSHVQNIYLLV